MSVARCAEAVGCWRQEVEKGKCLLSRRARGAGCLGAAGHTGATGSGLGRGWVIHQRKSLWPPHHLPRTLTLSLHAPSHPTFSASLRRTCPGASSTRTPSSKPWATCCASATAPGRPSACPTCGSPCWAWSWEPPATPCLWATPRHSSSRWTRHDASTKRRWEQNRHTKWT